MKIYCNDGVTNKLFCVSFHQYDIYYEYQSKSLKLLPYVSCLYVTFLKNV